MGHQINFILYFLVSFIVSGISLLKSFVIEVGLGEALVTEAKLRL